jgi:hypothetical protein
VHLEHVLCESAHHKKKKKQQIKLKKKQLFSLVKASACIASQEDAVTQVFSKELLPFLESASSPL